MKKTGNVYIKASYNLETPDYPDLPQSAEDTEGASPELCLTSFGIEHCRPSHGFGPGEKHEYMLFFIIDGFGYFEYDGKSERLGPNNVFLIMPEQTVRYYADDESPWQYIWISFLGRNAMTYIDCAGYGPSKLTGRFADCISIKSYIKKIAGCHDDTVANSLIRNASLMEILALLIDAKYKDPSSSWLAPKQSYIEQAGKYIEANYQNNLTVSAIAESIGIDRSYLTRIFRELLNISPQEYIKRFRIDRAALMLQNPDVKISEVSRNVGYNDYTTFLRLFKEYRGLTPTEYRKKLQRKSSV